MCARVKGWWEHNRVKANPTITQKHKKVQDCSNRLAVHSLPPSAIWKLDPWNYCRSQPPGGSLAPAWRHTRKIGAEAFYWYAAWRLVPSRQAVPQRCSCWAF